MQNYGCFLKLNCICVLGMEKEREIFTAFWPPCLLNLNITVGILKTATILAQQHHIQFIFAFMSLFLHLSFFSLLLLLENPPVNSHILLEGAKTGMR